MSLMLALSFWHQGGVWYQRCYDHDCRDYRSEAMPMPLELTRYVTLFMFTFNNKAGNDRQALMAIKLLTYL